MLRRLLLLPIRAYRYFISPMLPPSCRYYPSCSNYAVEAIETHGALRGSALALWRILRCNPFSHGGHDPVPPVAGDKHRCDASVQQAQIHD